MTDKATSDLWWKNAVIYCADVATWLDSDGDGIGDLAGLTRRLDYLWGLGVNTLWLMPFYPSPLGDDGYDITDYYVVDPRFGTLGDFVEMIRTADNLGIRVLIDLVLSHTSSRHPWFQRARHDRGSRYRDYYRWSDTKQSEPSEVAFPGEQTSTWTYDDVAGQWYMHRYYDFMPDLNITDPDVPRHPPQAQFANFCRHHDELNLGLLSDSEREEVFAAFAPEVEHRVYGRGIRRRLAPMLGNDQQRIRLALALTMALPGTPVLLYGDEIGMGEDLSLSGRLAVRNPMQWSPEQAGGFSTSDALYRPAHAEGPYGYRTVNVADQRHDPGSLHSWVAQAIRVRRESPELGWGKWRTLDVDDPHVLAIETRWRDDRTVTLHNLSAEPAKVRLPDDAEEPGHGQPMRQMLGDTDPPYRPGEEITLGRYGFRWLRQTD
jgi:glycosidase